MRVTILGSGTAIPRPDRFPSGALVQAGDETLLVDLGPGTLRRLAAAGVQPDAVTTVLVTHFHTDHTGGLPELLFALRNPRYAGRGPLRLVGSPGLAALVRGIQTTWPRWTEAADYELRIDEIDPGQVELAGTLVTAVPVDHTPASLAYRIDEPATGASAAFSGDADTLRGLADVARGVDLFVCEAALPDEERCGRHLSPRMAGEAAEAARCKTLCLTHLYPECEALDVAALARRAFSGEVVVAEDLLAFDLPGG